jgi:hypothetical protein
VEQHAVSATFLVRSLKSGGLKQVNACHSVLPGATKADA